jgi:hypothetical protein
MEMNQKKTKIMIVNGSEEDRTPIKTETFDISYTPHYVYLGAHFTDDAKISSVIKLEGQECLKHIHKFACFVNKNQDMPYAVKAKVLNAALLSSILYSCESWLTDQLSQINKHYMSAVKLLVGVRITTPNMM